MYGTSKKKKKDKPSQPKLTVKVKAKGHAATKLLNRLGYNPQPNA